jgi:hypothetical protein
MDRMIAASVRRGEFLAIEGARRNREGPPARSRIDPLGHQC